MTPPRWPVEAIEQAVAPLWPGFTVDIVPELDSTNTELMRRARAGCLEPVLLVAEHQSAGRGRLGRGWSSRAGDSLTCSLGLPLTPAGWQGLSLAAGVAAAGSLHPEIGLKWPNDLWWRGRKLAGILVETASAGARRYVVLGIGVNIAAPPLLSMPPLGPPSPNASAAEAAVAPPAWLRELLPAIDAPQALLRLAPALAQAALTFEAHGFAPFQARFNARDVLRGHVVVLTGGPGPPVRGTACGVDDAGALLVHTARGMQSVTSAEVSVRPAPAPATAVG